jgi:putative tryptophan/tyrosine transport system substrate-binding protein
LRYSLSECPFNFVHLQGYRWTRLLRGLLQRFADPAKLPIRCDLEPRLVDWGRNVAIEYRWAIVRYDRLPGLAADLVRRQVAVIAATGGTVFAAKPATATIPIVFNTGVDPVKAGLVVALNKPGGNITGITTINTQLGTKWVGLMHELLPSATRFALLVNPEDRMNTIGMITDVQGATAALGLQVEILYASTSNELETALASVVQKQAGALMIVPGGFFLDRSVQIATLALRDGVPAIYANRAFFPKPAG